MEHSFAPWPVGGIEILSPTEKQVLHGTTYPICHLSRKNSRTWNKHMFWQLCLTNTTLQFSQMWCWVVCAAIRDRNPWNSTMFVFVSFGQAKRGQTNQHHHEPTILQLKPSLLDVFPPCFCHRIAILRGGRRAGWWRRLDLNGHPWNFELLKHLKAMFWKSRLGDVLQNPSWF